MQNFTGLHQINEKNNIFYETLTADGLQEFAERGGLTSGCDMYKLTPYWSEAQSILDVGAGYGRAIKYLLNHDFRGKITAIERCTILYEYLKKEFLWAENVNLIHADALHLPDMDERFDLILMLWSAFADFSPKEQQLLFFNLRGLLNDGGRLIIDTMPENVVPLLANECGSQIFLTKNKNNVLHTYEPNAKEIQKYAKEAGFSQVTYITCHTDIGRERWLHVIS